MFERFKLWNIRRRARQSLSNATHAQAAAIMTALGSSHVPHARAVAAVAAERAEETAPTDTVRVRCRRVRDALREGYRVKVGTYPALVRTGDNPLSLATLAEIEDALSGATQERTEDD